MNAIPESGVQENSDYLLCALAELSPCTPVYAQDLYAYLVQRDGQCTLTVQQIQDWFCTQDCTE